MKFNIIATWSKEDGKYHTYISETLDFLNEFYACMRANAGFIQTRTKGKYCEYELDLKFIRVVPEEEYDQRMKEKHDKIQNQLDQEGKT